MQFDSLLFERRDQLAVVTLNRPDKLNALNLALVDELAAAAALIDNDQTIHAVLMTGAGRGFCSGADLAGNDFLKDDSRSHGANIGANLREHFNPMVAAWHDLRVPVVVAVNGVAAGAGMSIALMGDLVLAARSATFLQLFAPKLGLMPDLGSTFFLPRLVGTARAKGMALLGGAVSADEAASWGLIWSAVEDAALFDHALGIATRLASGPSAAFRHIKKAFNREPSQTLQEQLEFEAVAQAELGDSQDFAEGLRAFRAKQTPSFRGI